MRPDVVIAGAGLIGMACALECAQRGLRVTLMDKGTAGQEASWAAAGMLAAHDPANPPALQELSILSLALYPAFLEHLVEVTGLAMPFETEWTLEQSDAAPAGALLPEGLIGAWQRIPEHSLDPRKLTAAAAQAIRALGIDLREHLEVTASRALRGGDVEVQTQNGATLHCGAFVDCTGAWSGANVHPAKGQMLRLMAPAALRAGELGNVVVRTPDLYLVPRLDDSVVVGATVEDVGFNKTVYAHDLASLRQRAEALLPTLRNAPMVEQWAGLRPATADGLPLIGSTAIDDGDARVFVAAGHFRNGVLLAPATGHVVTQLLLGERPSADLHAFAPYREAITGPCTDESRRENMAREKLAAWRVTNKPEAEPHRRPAPRNPLYWYARVTGVPPGKERCSNINLINFVWDAKRYVDEETVPDYLVLRWSSTDGWSFTRGYLGSRRTRGNTYGHTLADADRRARALTGGLLTPWLTIPKAFHADLPAFAASQEPTIPEATV